MVQKSDRVGGVLGPELEPVGEADNRMRREHYARLGREGCRPRNHALRKLAGGAHVAFATRKQYRHHDQGDCDAWPQTIGKPSRCDPQQPDQQRGHHAPTAPSHDSGPQFVFGCGLDPWHPDLEPADVAGRLAAGKAEQHTTALNGKAAVAERRDIGSRSARLQLRDDFMGLSWIICVAQRHQPFERPGNPQAALQGRAGSLPAAFRQNRDAPSSLSRHSALDR